MIKRSDGFLGEDKIDHNGEQFKYIQELHEYLWRFTRCAFPSASGVVDDYIDEAIEKLENSSNAL